MLVTSYPVQLVLPISLTPRSEGIHLSGIIRSIAIQSGLLEVEDDEDGSLLTDQREITDPHVITRISRGLAWEEWYIRTQLPEVVDHPGEVCLDEVFMTPDGEELTSIIVDRRPQYALRVHEVKYTSKSMNTVFSIPKHQRKGFDWTRYNNEIYDSAVDPIGPLTSQWMWMAQCKGYCKAKDTRLCSLHVLFNEGDYSWPRQPRPYRFDIEFTQAEIDDNWQLLTEHRDYVMGYKDKGAF